VDRELEREIRALWDAGRFEDAATCAMRGYGPQVYGFLVARLRSEDRADDVFAQLGEDLWRGIESFRWQAAFSTWMYTLARHAAHRFERTPQNQGRRHTTVSRLTDAMERVRTETRPYLKTDIKDRFAELRDALSPDERTLLVLRVNRQLAWKDIAHVMSETPLDDAEATQASAALRQRFTSLKRKLRELAEERGLLDRDAG
jgi:RNA polymerase sigma-70 factor, ECF subfamily